MKKPILGKDVFLARGAVVTGEVQLGDGVSVWHNAVLRADAAPITIGPASNIQDGCVLHVDAGHPLEVGRGVSVGHGPSCTAVRWATIRWWGWGPSCSTAAGWAKIA